MGRSGRGVYRYLIGTAGALAIALFTHNAVALPPVINSSPIAVQIPDMQDGAVVINLRELGAISGSAPLIVDEVQLLVNGVPAGGLDARLFSNNGPGFVCIVIENTDFSLPSQDTFELELAIRSLSTPQPTRGRIALANIPGPVVDPAEQLACNDPNTRPVANAGDDFSVVDIGAPGESIELDGSASSDVDPDTVLLYQWSGAGTSFPESPNASVTTQALLPGTYTFALTVRDDSGDRNTELSETDSVTVTVIANAPPTANAGEDQTIIDTNGEPGEPVSLAGSGTDSDGTIATYQWLFNDSIIGTTATLETILPDGVNELQLVVTDDAGDSAADVVIITVADAATPTANAGADQEARDTDGEPGENVALDGSASAATGGVASYVWQNAQQQQIATGATANVRLPDGQNLITLIVSNNAGVTASDTVQINVSGGLQTPTANAGIDQSVADSDREAGEIITLDGSSSIDPNGQALSYQWSSALGEQTTVLGTTPVLSVRLPDGENTVSLRVQDSDGNVAVDTVEIAIAAPALRAVLAELPNLTPNKRAVALALDRICVELDQLAEDETSLTGDQAALQSRCNALYFESTAAEQSEALEALGADDFAAARTQTLLFSNTLYASVMDRLVALRGGARGLSLAGLNIVVDGQIVPLAQLQEMAKGLLGGGASSDADDAGGLLSDKWGMWARGNYSFGEKERTASAPSFEADQWSLIGGLDYRLSEESVIGGSFAYGQSGIDFNPRGEGALDTTSWAASLYGSAYAAKNFYFDAILNVANSDYEAERNITYVDGSGLVSEDANGTTDGVTVSGGVSAGYDFIVGGLTVSPSLGAFYIDATIDEFTESGAAGLNLIYDEQQFTSLTGNLGVRFTYAWNLSWGVLLPHLRVDYVREFEDEVDVFGVRFAADPNATSTPPILVETDNPDRSYWRMATGFSAQLAQGISGYVEYQRLESFDYISFEDLSFGLRMQKSF